MKRQNAQTLGEAIRHFLEEQHALNKKLQETRLIQSWDEIVGSGIANYTTHLEVKNKKLYVTLSSSLLRHDLTLQRHLLIAKINDFFQDEIIVDIRFL
jgi:predicted nucleic acid-binding Zn ribbon protein